MNCPECKKILFSDKLDTCPFCGALLKDSAPTSVTTKSVPRFVPDRLGKKDKSTQQMDVSALPSSRGAVPRFDIPPTKPEESTIPAAPIKPEIPPRPETKTATNNPSIGNNMPSALASQQASSSVGVSATEDAPPIADATPSSAQQPASPAIPEMNLNDEDDEEQNPSRKQNKFSKLFGRIKKKNKKSSQDLSIEHEDTDTEEYPFGDSDSDYSEDDPYDTNADGYYDDLIPELARQINSIPQENIIKGVILVIGIIIAIAIILITS